MKTIHVMQLQGSKNDVAEEIIQNHFAEFRNSHLRNCELIFTDGSKKDHMSGYAYFHQKDSTNQCRRKYRTNRAVSIFVAEALAIYESLVHIADHPEVREICVISDSLSVIQAVNNTKNSFKQHYTIGMIWDLIELLSDSGIVISLMWVPSHVGINGNEIADKLAQEALFDPDESHDVARHFSETSTEKMRKIREKWQTQWNSSDKGRFCFSILPKISSEAWYKRSPLDRQKIVFWNRIISNHTRCKKSLNRFEITNSALCPCGENYQSVDHIIFECPETIEQTMIDKLKSLGYHPPWIIRDIVASELSKNERPAMSLIGNRMAKNFIEKNMI